MNNLSREAFLKLSVMGLAALPLVGMKALEDVNVPALNQVPRVHLFSKHLQFLDYDKMSRAAAELGFDGLDVTVRKGGHVTPAAAAAYVLGCACCCCCCCWCCGPLLASRQIALTCPVFPQMSHAFSRWWHCDFV